MPEEPLNLEIDKLRLDEEWVKQPALYYRWAVRRADAEREAGEAKSRLSIVYADLDRDVRENPDDYDLKKTTNDSVESMVRSQPEYKAALNKLNDANHKVAIYTAAVEALEHRKRALTMLVELWVREYYSGAPHGSVSKDAEDFVKESARTRGRRRLERDEESNDDEDPVESESETAGV